MFSSVFFAYQFLYKYPNKKAFQVFDSLKGFIGKKICIQVLLGRSLFRPYENTKTANPGCIGHKGCAHKHRGHLVAGQLLMLVFPKKFHIKIPFSRRQKLTLINRHFSVK
jgi:hypothetical protein